MKKPGRRLLQADGHSLAREPSAEHGHLSMKRFGAAFNSRNYRSARVSAALFLEVRSHASPEGRTDGSRRAGHRVIRAGSREVQFLKRRQ
jgi:hypothetical protein